MPDLSRLDDRARPRLSQRGVAWRLFLTCWLVYVLHFATNSVRELYPTLSLGDRLSFDVSEYLGLHPDIFELPGRGVFINNNPGASIMGAIPYAVVRPLVDRVAERVAQARAASGDQGQEYDSIYPMAREFHREARARGLDVKLGVGAGVTQALLMAPLSAASAVLMFFILARGLPRLTALLLALLYAFATPVFYRTAQLNHNLLLGHAAFLAFVLLWRPWDDPVRPGRPRWLWAGLLTGWAVVLDYSGLVVVAVLSVYALVRWRSLPSSERSLADLVRFAVGVGLAGAVLMGYQWLAFGHPIWPAQRYMPPTEWSIYGYNGMDLPQPDLLWETAFGPRFGLFTAAPLLLLALWIPAWGAQRQRLVPRREVWCIVAFTIAFFLFSAASHYGRLQFNSGVRYIVPVVPFLFLLAAGALVRLPQVLAIGLGVAATFWSWSQAMYRDVEQGLGIVEAPIHIALEGPRLPWLQTIERMGYVPAGGAVPLLLLAAAILWVLWTVRLPAEQGPKQEPVRLKQLPVWPS